ncbi:MAG: CinA family protein, partial [Promethearchaeota archaeon]
KLDLNKNLNDVVNLLINNGKTIAIAESCTGGFISHMITNIPGASKTFDRGFVCYSNEAKIDVINVEPEVIKKFGAVSEEVARQLAYNVRILSNVDIGIGITGIAGPTGGTPEKPVGLVYIGISTEEDTIVEKNIFQTDRINFKAKVLERVLQLIKKN